MGIYGQFCPVAIASEVLAERWTPLVLRELLAGSARFNEIRRGLPLMSPTLLTKRLRVLERVGIVERARAGSSIEYALTPAGEELRPVIEAMGTWGKRWGRGDTRSENLDASLLMWDIHRCVAVENFPARRVVVFFRLRGSSDRKSRFWLVLDRTTADICMSDPGHDVDLQVETHVRTLVHVWMGDISFADAIASGEMKVEGVPSLRKALPTWFTRSVFAQVERATV